MKKIQCFLATIALIMSLSGISLLRISLLQGMGVGALANAASNWHASAPLVPGKVSNALHIKPYGPCLGGGSHDC